MKKQTNTTVNAEMKARANRLFAGAKKDGIMSFKPLQHKDGRKFTDIEYFELLGRKCIEKDKLNPNPKLPTDYGNYDRNVCEVAKEICKGIDAGLSNEELQTYLDMCIDREK